MYTTDMVVFFRLSETHDNPSETFSLLIAEYFEMNCFYHLVSTVNIFFFKIQNCRITRAKHANMTAKKCRMTRVVG